MFQILWKDHLDKGLLNVEILTWKAWTTIQNVWLSAVNNDSFEMVTKYFCPKLLEVCKFHIITLTVFVLALYEKNLKLKKMIRQKSLKLKRNLIQKFIYFEKNEFGNILRNIRPRTILICSNLLQEKNLTEMTKIRTYCY